MASDGQTILNEIIAHMNKEGGPAHTWYAGITSDVGSRLHGAHSVPEKDHWFITQQAQSSEDAREVERILIEVVGCDGGTGGGDETSSVVYCYKKTSITNP